MAWNPNVPTVTNRVQDDLNAIRENFQHLDQLAERVDELQTVSELAPIANDLQTVSGLASITDDLQVVSELAPYVQAILNSRIVEHNLDVTNPPNGYYVRFENGLQVCWHVADEGEQSFSESGALYTVGGTSPQSFLWTYPAAFAQIHIATGSFFRPGTGSFDGFVSIRTLSAESMLYRYYSVVGGVWTARSLLMAIGRWK